MAKHEHKNGTSSASADSRLDHADVAPETDEDTETQASDPHDLYFQQIGDSRLLTQEEEQALAQTIVRARTVFRERALALFPIAKSAADIHAKLQKKRVGWNVLLRIEGKSATGAAAEHTLPVILANMPKIAEQGHTVLSDYAAALQEWRRADVQEAGVPAEVHDIRQKLVQLLEQAPLRTHLLERLLEKADMHTRKLPALLRKKHLSAQETQLLQQFINVYHAPLQSIRPQVESALEAHGTMSAAKHDFVAANLRFAMFIAKKYRHRGLPYLDLIQEANRGLMVAVEKYGPDRKLRFSTHAVHWITQRVRRAIAENESTGAISLHTLIENDLTLGGALQAPAQGTPEATMDAAELRAVLQLLLQELSNTERDVITMLFDLDGQGRFTMDSIGHILNLSNSSVRQYAQTALRKLQHPSRIRHLKRFDDTEPTE